MKKNDVFLFVISHLVPEIFKVFVSCKLGMDDVIRCDNTPSSRLLLCRNGYPCILVQGIYEIFKADLKLIATELLLSPKGRYKCPKQHTKSTKKSHWWNMPNFASKMA